MTVRTDPTQKFPESKQPSGFLVIVHDPFQWPNSASFIPSGSATSIVIKPTYFYTSPDVHRLSPIDRQCIFPVCENFLKLNLGFSESLKNFRTKNYFQLYQILNIYVQTVYQNADRNICCNIAIALLNFFIQPEIIQFVI